MPHSTNPIPASFPTIAILIPSWRPGPQLPALISTLQLHRFALILIVDDGSGPAYTPLFNDLASIPNVRILHHTTNFGKGRALKTGLATLLAHTPALQTVITADSDGQHSPADILALAAAALTTSRPILGVRHFDSSVPLLSRAGNLFTRLIFRLITGIPLSDTQTGLRAIPVSLLPEILPLPGDRYEYEMSVLAHLCRSHYHPVELPIATIYFSNNQSSHFRPLLDSTRISLILLRVLFYRAPKRL